MTHSHRRINAHTGPFPTIPVDPATTDYKASGVRSREDKTHAALQAQRRAAANREEVLRDTAHLVEENDRHARDQTHRQSSRNRYTPASSSQENSNSERGQVPRGVRFSSPATQQERVKNMSSQGKQTGYSRDRPRDHRSTDTSEASHLTHGWTSKLKALTSLSLKDKSPRTETHTSTSHDGQHRHRRQRSAERLRPPQHHAAANIRAPSTGQQARHSQPPPIVHHVQVPSAPFHQLAPQFQHYTQSTPTQRMDVCAGPSNWHVTASHGMPMPNAPPQQQAHVAPAQQGQSFQSPPQPRQADFFGQVAMHCLHNVQSVAQHQQHQPHPLPQQQQQQHRPVDTTTQSQQQAQGQAQTPDSAKKPATYPVLKNKMPVWDDQSQSVRWEWR